LVARRHPEVSGADQRPLKESSYGQQDHVYVDVFMNA